MGLLDDAIREHLELKRRRGADSDEVARQEHEALGAPQRAEFADPSAPAAAPVDEPSPVDEPPPPEPEPAPEDRIPPLDQPTVEYAPEDVPEPAEKDEPPREGDDVLEETPEFLQETPEHERLWFEQKPPRDFDLDR